MDTARIAQDLAAEQDDLDAVVAPLPPDEWRRPTPSPGWDVADQIGHLTYFDGAATLAITDPAAFTVERDRLFTAGAGGEEAVDALTLGASRAMAPAELLEAWRAGRRALAAAAATLADGDRVEWYGPSMSSRSFLTARLMEAWAHGQDVVDAVGADRPPTDRLRHIAQLGVITRGWSYVNRGLEVPEGDVRVELVGPSGDPWAWGPEGGEDLVTGPAQDFCLVVTQRRHLDDTALEVRGTLARDWLERAQAFAGPPTDGPTPTRSGP